MSGTDGRQKVTDEEIIVAIKAIEEPFFTASEIADEVGLSRAQAANRLVEMEEDDLVDHKPTGSGKGWWLC